ncbi:hypothetical protein nbrc107696_25590 [Gordonia spumicola]|uniref:AbiEi antitoxin N-terminal domain-containing protein n=1 Tax=Gordonia spumicola TaxID=589161 RepID=A0A7I9VAK7_9ACTN|nr:type IV toxin-antitoxin system AbiEi family antitoxin domain-containing protein [Gordonia spumicola]GEE02113.1 hypothetical protein nbrc107696_25590 [Gordonia spumicola]
MGMNLEQFPADDHGLILRRRALALGCSPAQLSRAVDAGLLERIDPGVLVPAAARTPRELHVLRARAVAGKHPGVVFVDETAAAIHGLPLLKAVWDKVHVAFETRLRGINLAARCGGVSEEHLTVIGGLLVTSIEQTAVDTACSTLQGFAGALTVFDSALRAGASRRRMEALLSTPRPGVGVARAALPFASSASANPGESWSRAQMIEAGLTAPRLQHRFFDDQGRIIGRSDFDWDGRLAGEFDGYGKYVDYLDGADTALDAVRREKTRQARLEDLGVSVVRWDWSDLEAKRMVARVTARLRALGIV